VLSLVFSWITRVTQQTKGLPIPLYVLYTKAFASRYINRSIEPNIIRRINSFLYDSQQRSQSLKNVYRTYSTFQASTPFNKTSLRSKYWVLLIRATSSWWMSLTYGVILLLYLREGFAWSLLFNLVRFKRRNSSIGSWLCLAHVRRRIKHTMDF
jgi:hypothetical protein